ncbi:hypothetical protein Tco_1341246 [Tanacetum coccineum]
MVPEQRGKYAIKKDQVDFWAIKITTNRYVMLDQSDMEEGVKLNMEKLEEDRMKEKEMQNEEEEDVIEVRIEIAEMCVVEEVLGKDDIALH